MQISDNGLALVMAFEGCHRAVPGRPGHFRAYKDPVGVLTIGWGHTNHHPPAFDAGTVWSQEQCDDALRADLETFERAVERHVRVPVVQHQFDALVSFAYNCGAANLKKSTLLRKVNARDFAGAAAEFGKWNRAGGRVLAGLTRRRRAEARMFQGAVNEALQVAGAKQRPTKPVARPEPAVIVQFPKAPPDVISTNDIRARDPVTGEWAEGQAPPPPAAKPGWFARLLTRLFGKD